MMRFRTLQLEMRVREVYEAYHSFKRLVVGEDEGQGSYLGGLAGEQRLHWLASLRDRVDMDEVYLTGHSFGGGTVVR